MPVIVPIDFEDYCGLINTDNKIFVLVYAWWCYGSQLTLPVFERLSNEFPESIFVKVEMDEMPAVVRRYNLDSSPTFMFFRQGGPIDTLLGGNVERLNEFIRRYAR